MPEGWSVRKDVDGVEWFSTDDEHWYHWEGRHRIWGSPVWP